VTDATRARLIDVALVAVVGTLSVLVIRGGTEAGSRTPDALGYALGLAPAVLLPLRHRWPRSVLVASLVLLHVYLALDYPAFSPAVPLGIPFYAVVVAGHLRFAVAMAALLLALEIAGRGFEGDNLQNVLSGTFYEGVLLAVILSLGEVVRSRRLWLAEVQARMLRAEQDAERESERRVMDERLRIAREIHDVVAHTISVVVVQAGLAADVMDERPAQAREALGVIRSASKDALNELRATVGVLRGQEPAGEAPGLGQIQTLLDAARASGLQVNVVRTGETRALPAVVDHTAYRILQEALTNVVRHAHAHMARVLIGYEPDGLTIDVVDDGSAPAPLAPIARTGHGLTGMAERVEALGGTFEAGRREEGGFLIRVRLPLRSLTA